MQKLIYVPPGTDIEDTQKCIKLTAEYPFLLSSVSGLGGVETNIISSEIVGMNGEYFHGCRRSPRPIKCKIWVKGKNRSDMYAQRMKAIGILSSNEQGILYYENDIISVKIQAMPKIPPDFNERICNYNSANVEFYCCSPDWESISENQADIAYLSGSGFRFPLSLNQVNFRQMRNDIIIDNKGTADAPVTIVIEGPSETPAITNVTTGKTITLERPLLSGELLTIYTERGKKKVRLTSGNTETDAFRYLSPVSRFWELKPGINHIRYGSGGTAHTSIHIRYKERYSGV